MNNLSSHNISLNYKFICSKSVVNLPYEIRANIKMKNLKKKIKLSSRDSKNTQVCKINNFKIILL